MQPDRIKRALISVYDKTGIVDFARSLVSEFGIEIISTGGTAKLLRENDIPVTLVEDITGWGEMLDGRVKTLHPKIHAAILADRDNPEHMKQLADAGIEPIDMVVVNLYPFEQTVADPNCKFEDAIEMIDIGGPCLLRAAAKNHKHVLVIDSWRAWEYETAIKGLRGDKTIISLREQMDRGAFSVFWRTSEYDTGIWQWLGGTQDDGSPSFFARWFFTEALLRYGENPHQEAKIVSSCGVASWPNLTTATIEREGEFSHDTLAGFSYNNFVDANAALQACAEIMRAWEDTGVFGDKRNACVVIKHTNPCGAALGKSPIDAYRSAYLGDPNAAMGGILACSFEIDRTFAEAVMESLATWGKEAGAGAFFVEVWIAPSFTDEAVEYIRAAKKWGNRVELLGVKDMSLAPVPEEDVNSPELRTITGGVLMQTPDVVGLNKDQWKVVTERQPTPAEMDDLRLAWLVCKHTKSNAISICKDGMLIGNGAGQMSRVMSCRIATWLANENGHAGKLAGSSAASDAFFPFRDGPDLLIDAGVTAIIQPGGSKRDADTIAACNERKVAMIFTGTRHFRH